MRTCPRCKITKPLTEEYFYVLRPRQVHDPMRWQSYCRDCWVSINAANKQRRKIFEYLREHRTAI